MDGEARERLARIETKLEVVGDQQTRIHADLKAHMIQEAVDKREVDKRLDTVEKEQVATRTHFRWLYGVWGFVQVGVIGWFKSNLKP
ncbi:MAG: hypothetical protein M5U26_08400 [Planctomycetota bacterium]|nr:hypothetical protein [Planctomycetota bacterium]